MFLKNNQGEKNYLKIYEVYIEFFWLNKSIRLWNYLIKLFEISKTSSGFIL